MSRSRPVSGETTLTRMWVLSAVAVVLGVVGGFAAVALFKLIGLMTHLTLLGDVGFDLPTLRGYEASYWLIPIAVGGGLIVSLFAAWSPVIRGHGIPESLEAILDRDSRIRPRAAIAKPLSAAITIGTGGPFGAEGPIIVTGGSVGSLMGQLLSVSAAERKIMLATGAAAGMSATFNTPIAAVILAIELILFERSLRVIVPLSIASAIAAAIHVVAFGSEPLFAVQAALHVGLAHLPWMALVGLASGLMAIVLNKGLFAMEAGFRRLPINIFWWPAIGALGFAVIGILVPRTLSMGYSAIIDTLNGRFTMVALAVLLGAKLLSWLIALGSQTSGGTLAPMFLVGAAMGCLLGNGVNAVFPNADVSPAAFALVAMGATFGAATKAFFAAVVFAAEVTGEFTMIVPLLIGAAVAELVVEGVLTDRLMTEKLSHRGFKVDFRTTVDALRTRVARQVMREPQWIRADADPGRARQQLAHHGVDRMAVARPDGAYLGTLSATMLAAAPPDDAESSAGRGACAASLADTTTAPIDADEYLATSLERFLRHAVDTLPVVDHGRVVGVLTRGDLVAERYRRSTAQEIRQAGWWASATWRPRFRSSLRSRLRSPRRPLAQVNRPATIPSPSIIEGPVMASKSSHGPTGPRTGARGPQHRLLPLPAQLSPGLGQFVLSERSRIVVAWGSDQAHPLAERLATELRPATGFRLSVSDGRAYRDDISLTLARPEGLPDRGIDEGYVLGSGVDGVSLAAPTLRGLSHGIQTIRQLLPVWITSQHRVPAVWTMPAMKVIDYPANTRRTVAVDLTHGPMVPGAVSTLIDRVADYKINDVLLCVPPEYVDHPERLVGYDELVRRAAQRFVSLRQVGGEPEASVPRVGWSVDGVPRLHTGLLRVAESLWSPASEQAADAGVPVGLMSRAAAQGPRLALTSTIIEASDDIAWRLHLVATPGRTDGRDISGTLGTLVAPGAGPEGLSVTVDWGDGSVGQGTVVPAITSGAAAGCYSIVGHHTYRRGGQYRVALLASAPERVPARASVLMRVGSSGRLRLRGPRQVKNTASRMPVGQDVAARAAAPSTVQAPSA